MTQLSSLLLKPATAIHKAPPLGLNLPVSQSVSLLLVVARQVSLDPDLILAALGMVRWYMKSMFVGASGSEAPVTALKPHPLQESGQTELREALLRQWSFGSRVV